MAAAFVHRTSRAGDPQLHTHVLAANAVLGADGRWSAPDARLLYFHGRTAGFVYQASLRAGLVESLGVRFGPVTSGAAEVAGLDPVVLRRFSTRRAEIEEYLFAARRVFAAHAELAALATRAPKGRATAPRGAATCGCAGGSQGCRSRRRPGPTSSSEGGPERCACAEGAATVMSGRAARARGAHRPGLGLRAARRRACHRRAPDRGRLPRRHRGGAPTGSCPSRGRGHSDARAAAARSSHTTRSCSGSRRRSSSAPARPRQAGPRVDGRLGSAPRWRSTAALSGEQRVMVERLATSGAGVEIVVGKAGAGKTTALALARQALRGSRLRGRRHRALGPGGRGARSLAGIDSVTLARFLGEMEKGARISVPAMSLVVDEAGMVGTRTIAKLVDLPSGPGAKLMLVGDPRQLPEIEAGGAFGALASPPRRHRAHREPAPADAWERLALDQLRRGDAVATLDATLAHERVEVVDRWPTPRAAMVAAWFEARHGTSDGLRDPARATRP